jgi:hypothetical protein
MAANTSPIFELTVTSPIVQIAPADTTTKKTLKAGTTNGSRIDAIYVSSTDTAAVVLNWYMNDGSTDFYMGDTTIAIGAGYTTVARADVMGTLAPTLGYIVIPNGYTLKVAANATITAAKVVDVVSQGGDY